MTQAASSRESRASASPSMLPSALHLAGSASPTPTAAECSSATSPACPSPQTCARLTGPGRECACSTAATPASPSRRQASGTAPPTPAGSGPRWLESLAYYDPTTSCWRTSQTTLLSAGTSCSVIWPAWGTAFGGECYELPTPAPLTAELESSPSLPTPSSWLGRRPENSYADPERAASRSHEGRRGDRSLELPEALALLPTPAARDRKGPHMRDREGGLSLGSAVEDIQTGVATGPPSNGGSASAATAHPDQLTIEGA